MIFNSLTFVVFFVVVLVLYHWVPMSWRARKIMLLVASYIFYAAWNPPFVLLLMGSTVIDWYLAGRMARSANPRHRRMLLLASLVFNLGVLAFFKYGGFLLANFVRVAQLVGVDYQAPGWSIVLPIGISFYTFLTLSYTIDVYQREMEPVDSLLDYAFFITFFPHLVAGPIIRARDFLPQCSAPRRATPDQMGWGLALITIGLFEKVFMADALTAPAADKVFNNVAQAGWADAWFGTLAFSAQIFFDFAGYTTCAIGVALCLGFVLTDNFRFPYAAIGFSDFWRRWHISLSTWLRDYLYVPLGGNRKGLRRTMINLMITMLLGGLWHGAAWHFVFWGAMHGSYLLLERFARATIGHAAIWTARAMQPVLSLVTYVLICLTWVFFRAERLRDGARITRVMFSGGIDHEMLSVFTRGVVVGVTVVLLATHWLLRDTTLEDAWRRLPRWARPMLLASMILTICLANGDERAFIYFQF